MRIRALHLLSLSGIVVEHIAAYELAPAGHAGPAVPHGHIPVVTAAASLTLVGVLAWLALAEGRSRAPCISLFRPTTLQTVVTVALALVRLPGALIASTDARAPPMT